MKNTIIIITSIAIISLYILISHFILKRKLNIKEKRLHLFSKDRNKLFLIVEIIAITAFVVISIIYINISDPAHFSLTFIPKLTFVVLFIVEIIRGMELWMFNRDERSYYYRSLGAAMFLTTFLLFYFTEDYLL